MSFLRRLARLAGATALAGGLLGCASGSGGSTAGEYMDDTWITTRAKAALVGTEGVSALRISVETYGGIVRLGGYAASRDEMDKAIRSVRAVPGVRAVRNDIRLRAPDR